MAERKIDATVLKQKGFKAEMWKDGDATYEQYVINNKQVKIEVYGETPEVDINVNGEWIRVPDCKTEADLKALLKLFGFPCNNNKNT